MAALAIVTSSPPETEGGHLVIARSLVQAARDAGSHFAHRNDCDRFAHRIDPCVRDFFA